METCWRIESRPTNIQINKWRNHRRIKILLGPSLCLKVILFGDNYQLTYAMGRKDSIHHSRFPSQRWEWLSEQCLEDELDIHHRYRGLFASKEGTLFIFAKSSSSAMGQGNQDTPPPVLPLTTNHWRKKAASNSTLTLGTLRHVRKLIPGGGQVGRWTSCPNKAPAKPRC